MPDDLVERLYAAPPDGFVAARAEAVTAARASGDKDLAKSIAALRKPTVAAWLVNLLAWRTPELLDELVELAAALRSAQRELQGEQLRELSSQRRRVVSGLVAQARKLAVQADPSTSAAKLPLVEVENTLTAALADTDIAEQVRSGRLIRAVSYAGFGEVPRPRLRLVGDDDPPPPARSTTFGGTAQPRTRLGVPPTPDGAGIRDAAVVAADAAVVAADASRRAAARRERATRRHELERELTTARNADTRAQQQLDRADAAERDALHAVAEIEAQLAELEQRRSAAQAEVSQRKLARRAAQRDAAAARRRIGDVQAAIEASEDDGPGTP